MNRQRLLERFLEYVQIDTTADDATDDYPSSPGQLTLGRLLTDQLRELGAESVEQTEKGLVLATIPATNQQTSPVVALNAHLDTSPETTGANVKPQVIESYQGGDLQLPGDPDRQLTVAENPALKQLVGATLITTDGTTLLGGDDKAGLAVIMEFAAHLLENPQISHGPIRVLFTCDEEIGRGVDHVDFEHLAADVAYTLDGDGAGKIDVETFSADMASIVVQGVNIHPSIGKDRMVNAIRATAVLLENLPRELAPETTEGREGFLHPYQIEGGVAEVTLKVLLRDFDTSALAAQQRQLHAAAQAAEAAFPGVSVRVDIREQYRNMSDGLANEPRAVEFARLAHERLGRAVEQTIVRGGTDGSLLTANGLPTPNLSTGQHNQHSPLEWACLDEMQQAVEVLVELVQLWGE